MGERLKSWGRADSHCCLPFSVMILLSAALFAVLFLLPVLHLHGPFYIARLHVTSTHSSNDPCGGASISTRRAPGATQLP